MTSLSSKKNITSLKDVKKREYTDPKCKWDPKIEEDIRRYIRQALSKSNTNVFENISDYFQAFCDRSCDNMIELKKRTKNESGFVWEHFCLMYLRSKGYGNCWLLSETPTEILEKLKVSRVDMGIDIIIKHENGYFAVQAKWRSNKHKKSKMSLTWNKLATFYALCARTGPWLKYIVITNCDFVRRQGKKYKMDQTIAKGSFIACNRDTWMKMCDMKEGQKIVRQEPIMSSDLMSSDLLSSVCQATGRSSSFYKDWDDNCLRQRLEYYQEYEKKSMLPDQSTLQTLQTLQTIPDRPLTLQEKQRFQRSSFLDKLFPK